MARFWQQIIKGETGQALPVVLVLLVIGGLLIAPCLSYASTSLNAGQIVEENVRGVYAADAGVEYALWCLKNSISPPEQLPEENVNQMAVAIDTVNSGNYTLYYGELILTRLHSDWLDVSAEMVWDEVAEAYKYTITVTRLPVAEGNVKLSKVGVRLPIGYSYQPGSAASFFGNLSTDEPDDTLDGAGAYMLGWELAHPELSEENPTATQTFCVTGEGEQEGDYTWVEAVRMDIWVAGEVTGGLYRITATATRPEDGEITAIVMADVTLDEATGDISIILWQINPQ